MRFLAIAVLAVSIMAVASSSAGSEQAPFVNIVFVRPVDLNGVRFFEVDYRYHFPNLDSVYISDLGPVPPTGSFDYYTRSHKIEFRASKGGVVLQSVDVDATLQELRTALGVPASNAHDYIELGRAQLSEGDQDSAVQSFHKALGLNPTTDQRASATLMLADTYEASGDHQRARAAFATVGSETRALKPVVFDSAPLHADDRQRICGDGLGSVADKQFAVPTGTALRPPPKDLPWDSKLSLAAYVDRIVGNCFHSYAASVRWGIVTFTSTYDSIPSSASGVSASFAIKVSGIHYRGDTPYIEIEPAIQELRDGKAVDLDRTVMTAANQDFDQLYGDFRNAAPPQSGN